MAHGVVGGIDLPATGERIELSWRDGETLRLPEKIDLFSERSLNRDLYLWLVALSAADVDDSLPWIVRNQKATQATLERFPGLASRYHRLVNALLTLRPLPTSLPTAEAAQESAIRQALTATWQCSCFATIKKTISTCAALDAPKSASEREQ